MEQSTEINNIQQRINHFNGPFKNPLYLPDPQISEHISKLISELKDKEYISGRAFKIHHNNDNIDPTIDPNTIIGYMNRQRIINES